MSRITLAALVLAVLVSGCTHVTGGGSPPNGLSRDNAVYDTRTSMGPCLGQAHASLAGAIASSIVASGVNRIGAALEEAAKARTDTTLAQRNLLLSNGGQLGPCVFVARGWFNSGNGSGSGLGEFAGDAAALRGLGLDLAAEPDFYFEGQVFSTRNRTVHTIAPLRTRFGEPLVTNDIRGDRRSLSVSFAFVPQGKTVTTATGGTTVVLGNMEPGDTRESDAVWCAMALGAAAATAPCTGAETGAYGFVLGQEQSEWFSVELTPDLQPMTLAALVTETREPSAFLGFVAAIFKENQAAITSEAQGALVPSVAEANREAELTARDQAEATYDAAWSKASTTLTTCAAAGSAPATRLTARTDLRAFIQVARRADRVVTSLETRLAAIRLDDETHFREACQTASTALAGFAA